MDKGYLFRKDGLNAGIVIINKKFGTDQTFVYFFYCCLEKIKRSFACFHSKFPVPLVNIERVNIIEFLIGTDCIHIGINTETGVQLQFGEFNPLPLCQ